MTTAFDEIMAVRGKGAPPAGEVSIANSDPVLDSRFRLGQTCAAALAGVGVAVNDIWEMKTAQRQHIDIDVRHAAAALKSTHYLQRPDSSGSFQTIVNAGHQAMMKITQPWATRDGRFVLTHFGLPHLQARMLALLGCDPTPESVAAAVAKWDALELEAAIDEHRAVELAIDRAAALHEHLPDRLPLGAGLDRDERVAQEPGGDPFGVVGALREFDAPLLRPLHLSLAAAAGVDLRLDGADGCAERGERRGGLVGGAGDLAGEHGDTGCAEEVLGLKLVNLHRVELAAEGTAG